MDFNLSSFFNAFNVDKEYTLEFSDLDGKIENVTDSLANNPESINYNHDLFDDLVELTHCYKSLDSKHQRQLSYLISSSFSSVGLGYNKVIESGDFVDQIDGIKSTLEKYGYLVFVLLKFLGKEEHTHSKSKNQANTQALARWKSTNAQIEDALQAISTVLKLELSKVFVTTPERDLYLELFSRPIMNLMESPERMKVQGIKTFMFNIISVSVKYHGHSHFIQHSIIQCLTYYLHSPPYMAELLHLMADKYDYIMLTEEVLREISQTQFNSNDTNGPKAVSEFLIKLSELSPRLILKQMSCISQLLDNSNQTLRCSVVEACGNIVVDILKNTGETSAEDEEINSGISQHVDGLLDLLQERFLDQNPYVRSKAFQAFTKITNLKVKLTERRQKLMILAVRSLDDKSTLVRRNAIKLMSKLVLTHQFNSVHGSQLGLTFWMKHFKEAEEELQQYLPTSPQKEKAVTDDAVDMEIDNEEDQGKKSILSALEEGSDSNSDSESENDHDEEEMLSKELPDRNVLYRAKLKADYYRDAVAFIDAIHHAIKIISKLLFSKNRNEAIDSMDFLVLADAYGIETAPDGIRKMLHLVWLKGSSEEGKSVPTHLIDCYRDLYLTAPFEANKTEKTAYIAKNLISLTENASIADLASLEKLLGLMHAGKLISQDVIRVLWQIYNFEGGDADNGQINSQRRGAIIILGMLALEDSQIVIASVDSILKIGLGSKGQDDLTLARYSCVALQRIVSNKKEHQLSNWEINPKLRDEVVDKLKLFIIQYDSRPEWYGVAEQAISAIYHVATNPDEDCSDLIKEKAVAVFKKESSDTKAKIVGLSQLLFIVGHVAIKTIVYLERLEAQFKKKKHDLEAKKGVEDPAKNKNKDEPTGDDELEMIGGTSEDDFTDAVIHVKEKELLYGEHSILARFGPLVKEICANNKNYDNNTLQRSAVLCMTKLMCVSSIYCEQNLPLLITIMEKSEDPIIRSNCVLGLGDMAVCFNNVVDESTDFLYRRLTDNNLMVQRTCLMTVTFLILAGQVKVKGQLSAMAKCLENKDQGISDMCRLFFTELSTKDNAIYNGFIDIFSGLSSDETLDKDATKRIIKFLVSFIDKEKHQKQLLEKLLVRLLKCQTELEWNDVAYVLTTIPYKNESITNALEEGYKMVLAR